ncbi:hypothetical protein ACH5RR_013681 [Cinchona calisaya]|uniref:Uncharacterized protein n=1 Tax=Cinchona calisaya TaxID=153742 RepID=A0ABD3A0T9_9GENT
MKDLDNVTTYQKSIERLRVHKFLAGLDGDFEQVCGEILRKEPIPSLEECYALIRRKAVRRATLKDETKNSEAAAMVTRNRSKTTKSVEKFAYKCTTVVNLHILKIVATNMWDIQNGDDTVDKRFNIGSNYKCLCDAKIDTEKGDVNGIILDLDSYLEAEEVSEPQDTSSSLEEFESLINVSHQSSTEIFPILELELPRK